MKTTHCIRFKHLYPLTVIFTRRFNRGPLSGLLHRDCIPMIDRAMAARWIRGIRRNSRLGQLDYSIFDVSVVPTNTLAP